MQSIWTQTAGLMQYTPFPVLQEQIKTDVLIIGGGMAGILTAYHLQNAGIPCIILEASTIGSGVTKNTTAKITAQHGLIYADSIKRHGLEATRGYLNANQSAIHAFRRLAETYPCDFEEKTAFVYSANDRKKLDREAESYQKLGISVKFLEHPPLPVKTIGALGMENQAQFHPLKLLTSLAKKLTIYENSFVRQIENFTAFTEKGIVSAKHIVLATHFPLVNIPGLYFMKLYQHRSYVLALDDAPLVTDMFVDEQPCGNSFRTYENMLLLGGGDHKTGKPGGCFGELRALAGRAYPAAHERFHWATQDCMSLDGFPYIGLHRTGANNLYVATGFNKWGMTGSMIAAKLLCDLIIGEKNELAKLCSPQRSMLMPQLAANLGNALVGLCSFGGPRCPHMGCKLHKNIVEGTWDCACHGSRFDSQGHVIDNPAKRGIRP